AEAVRHHLRNGFTAYFVLSPATNSFLSPSSRELAALPARLSRTSPPQDLTPATGARTTRLHRTLGAPFVVSRGKIAHGVHPALRSQARLTLRVHRIPRPTYVTIMIRPSIGTGQGGYNSDFQNC